MKKLLVLALLLIAFPLLASAQDEQEVYLPVIGLQMTYPAGWSALNNPNFDVILVERPDDDQSGFVGVQSNALPPQESLESFMASLADQFGGAAESIELDGVAAWQIEVSSSISDVPSTLRLIGFEPSKGHIALLISSSPTDKWEAFIELAEGVLASVVIKPLALDSADLDGQLLASFEEDQTLRLGEPDAPLKVVEVLDFSCGHCANYSLSIKRLIQDYVLTGKVQLEFRLATFVGQDFSATAANAQYCAANLGFGWQMHAALFDIHLQEGAQMFTEENINSVVRTFEGVEAALFEACLLERPFNKWVDRDGEYIEDAGVDGTPAILVALGEEAPAFLTNQNGDPIGGGIALRGLYNRLDALVTE